jgi:hypothetical protein
MESIPQDTERKAREEVTIYESRAFSRLRAFKQGLVLDLFLRRGLFWELVQGLRDKRGIVASVQLPPVAAEPWMEPMRLLPADAPEYPGYKASSEAKEPFYNFYSRWSEDLGSILSSVLPDELGRRLDYRIREVSTFYDRQYLRTFCAACVLYDPPETQLCEFAEYHDPRAFSVGNLSSIPAPATKRVEMKMGSIEELPIRSDELSRQEHFYESLLNEIATRLESQGVDLRRMIEEIHRERPELLGALSEELGTRFYFNVDEHTTERDAIRAYRTIAASLSRSPANTKPRRDPLVAVQCAILHDRHNDTDPSDRRKRAWTYARLADEFSLRSAQAAKDHVKLGRELQNN